MRRLLILGTLLLLLGQMSLMAQVPLPTTAPGALTGGYVRAPRLGVTFINSTDHPISDRRYQQALLLGAGWTRWPLYWDRVETSPGSYNWSAYDRLVDADLRHGLAINAILLGRPGFHQEGGSIRGLDAPVFSDGSDTPGPGKSINPANEWAAFAQQAVNRYKPGGLLARQMGWPAGWGIRVWEAWNEPDLAMFWRGTVAQYARLLKVTYLAVHHADPQAQVMFGGLAYSNPAVNDWLDRVLTVYEQDSSAPRHNWYMDIVGVHNYSYARRSGEVVRHVRANLARRGLARPVWLNENGVPVWDDYPGPTWALNIPESRRLRASSQQQAAFVIQSAAYAWAEGADVVMFHQLYDDCGNQRAGTDFPPHDGGLCGGSGDCWGDAHGLFRNPADSICFRQHPLPGTPRPAAFAYRTLAQVFGRGDFGGGQVLHDGRAAIIAFDRPFPGERIYVVWNRSLSAASVSLPAVTERATLYAMDGSDTPLAAEDGLYRLSLPPAAPDDYPYLQPGDEAGIGGQPFIIVEQVGSQAAPLLPTEPYNPALVPFPVPVDATRQPLRPTPGPVLVGPTQEPLISRPAAIPAQDTRPPTTGMEPLPPLSPATFTVRWYGEDDTGIASYIVWVRINGAQWQPWLETTATSADYSGESGRVYEFAVWAVDLAGNWSANSDLQPQAFTRVE